MTATLVGYARVSTQGQNLESQADDLMRKGCSKVFQETYRGTTSGRKQLQAALEYVREGDSLVVTKLDRLARSAVDLGRIAEKLQKKGVELVVLDQDIDTSTPTGKLMFTMIGAFAEFERDLIYSRCSEGILKAKKRGVAFGRRAKLSESKKQELIGEFKSGKLGKTELADKYGLSRSSVYRLCSES